VVLKLLLKFLGKLPHGLSYLFIIDILFLLMDVFQVTSYSGLQFKFNPVLLHVLVHHRDCFSQKYYQSLLEVEFTPVDVLKYYSDAVYGEPKHPARDEHYTIAEPSFVIVGGCDVTIAHCGHSHNGPVEGIVVLSEIIGVLYVVVEQPGFFYASAIKSDRVP
jgi:hypothetical protein